MIKDKSVRILEGKSVVTTSTRLSTIGKKKQPELSANEKQAKSNIIEESKKSEEIKKNICLSQTQPGGMMKPLAQSMLPPYTSREKKNIIHVQVEDNSNVSRFKEDKPDKESVLSKTKKQVLKEHLINIGEASRLHSPTIRELSIQIPSSLQHLLEAEQSPKVIPTEQRSHEVFLRNLSRSPENSIDNQSKMYQKNTVMNIVFKDEERKETIKNDNSNSYNNEPFESQFIYYDPKNYQHFDLENIDSSRRRVGSNDDRLRRRNPQRRNRFDQENAKKMVDSNVNAEFKTKMEAFQPTPMSSYRKPLKTPYVKSSQLRDSLMTTKEKEDFLRIIELQNRGILRRIGEREFDNKKGVELIPEIIPTPLLRSTLLGDNSIPSGEFIPNSTRKKTGFYEIYNNFSNRLSDYLLTKKTKKPREKTTSQQDHNRARSNVLTYSSHFQEHIKTSKFNFDLSKDLMNRELSYKTHYAKAFKTVASLPEKKESDNTIRKYERGGIVFFGNYPITIQRKNIKSPEKDVSDIPAIPFAKKFSRDDTMKYSQTIRDNAAKFIQAFWRSYITMRKLGAKKIQAFVRGMILRNKMRKILYFYYLCQNKLVNLEKLFKYKLITSGFRRLMGDEYLETSRLRRTLKCIVLLQRSVKKKFAQVKAVPNAERIIKRKVIEPQVFTKDFTSEVLIHEKDDLINGENLKMKKVLLTSKSYQKRNVLALPCVKKQQIIGNFSFTKDMIPKIQTYTGTLQKTFKKGAMPNTLSFSSQVFSEKPKSIPNVSTTLTVNRNWQKIATRTTTELAFCTKMIKPSLSLIQRNWRDLIRGDHPEDFACPISKQFAMPIAKSIPVNFQKSSFGPWAIVIIQSKMRSIFARKKLLKMIVPKWKKVIPITFDKEIRPQEEKINEVLEAVVIDKEKKSEKINLQKEYPEELILVPPAKKELKPSFIHPITFDKEIKPDQSEKAQDPSERNNKLSAYSSDRLRKFFDKYLTNRLNDFKEKFNKIGTEKRNLNELIGRTIAKNSYRAVRGLKLNADRMNKPTETVESKSNLGELLRRYGNLNRLRRLQIDLQEVRKRLRLIDGLYSFSGIIKRITNIDTYSTLKNMYVRRIKEEKDRRFLVDLYKEMHLTYLDTIDQYTKLSDNEPFEPLAKIDSENGRDLLLRKAYLNNPTIFSMKLQPYLPRTMFFNENPNSQLGDPVNLEREEKLKESIIKNPEARFQLEASYLTGTKPSDAKKMLARSILLKSGQKK